MENVRIAGQEIILHNQIYTGFRRSFASEESLAVVSAVAADSIAWPRSGQDPALGLQVSQQRVTGWRREGRCSWAHRSRPDSYYSHLRLSLPLEVHGLQKIRNQHSF